MTEHFSKTLPTLQLAWDNTSLSLFKTCPRKYYYSMIEGWRTKTTKPALHFGSLFHGALEVYDRARAAESTHQGALRLAVRYTLLKTTIRHVNGTLSFWTSDDSNRSRETLLRSVIWYCEHFFNDPLETVVLPNGQPAIELSFQFELGFEYVQGEPYVYCGHIDKLARYGDQGVFVVDRKHSKSTIGDYYFVKYEMSAQLTGYVTAATVMLEEPVVGAVIDAAQVAVNFTRFHRGMTRRTKFRLSEFLADTQYWIEQAQTCAENHYWPQNHESCDKYGGCQFAAVCAKDAEIRKIFLQSDFKKEPWEPLAVRGDSE